VRKGLRKGRRDKTLTLKPLRSLRKPFAVFAVNGFWIFKQPPALFRNQNVAARMACG